jgi:hypothetical protein
MEPVFMILGQSAGTAAAMATDEGVAVQEVTYDKLRRRLLEDGQLLKYDAPSRGVAPSDLEGGVVDDAEAEFAGSWQPSSASTKFVGSVFHALNRDAAAVRCAQAFYGRSFVGSRRAIRHALLRQFGIDRS